MVDQILKSDDSEKKRTAQNIYRNMKNVKAGTVYLRNISTYQ
jgi:hypothetical protein